MQGARRIEEGVGDLGRVEGGVRAAVGEHRAAIAFHDDDDRAGAELGIFAEVRGDSGGGELGLVPFPVAGANPRDEVDGGSECGEPGGRVRGAAAGGAGDARGGVGVGPHRPYGHDDEVVDDVADQ